MTSEASIDQRVEAARSWFYRNQCGDILDEYLDGDSDSVVIEFTHFGPAWSTTPSPHELYRVHGETIDLLLAGRTDDVVAAVRAERDDYLAEVLEHVANREENPDGTALLEAAGRLRSLAALARKVRL